MSEVAGRMATQVGARFLEKPQGGKGKLMGVEDKKNNLWIGTSDGGLNMGDTWWTRFQKVNGTYGICRAYMSSATQMLRQREQLLHNIYKHLPVVRPLYWFFLS